MERTYSIPEIKALIEPVAQAYGVQRVYLFGSYARGDAKPGSDIDLRVDSGRIRGLFQFAGFMNRIGEKFDIPVDVLSTGSLDNDFLARIKDEEVLLYGT